MLIKKIEIMALLVIGFLVTRHKPLTPLLMVLFLFLNDFLTMSLSTDRMEYSRRPNRWNTRGILLAATVLAACKLVFSLGVFLCGYYVLRLDMPHLQTLMFATLILSSQAGVYLLRERGHFWQSQPSRVSRGQFGVGLGCRGDSGARWHSHAGAQRVPSRWLGGRWDHLLRLPGLAQGLAFQAAESAVIHPAVVTGLSLLWRLETTLLVCR